MKIYTLYYADTQLFNRSIFVIPNDAAAKKAMMINLMDPKAESFRNEVKLGNVYLYSLATFTEETAIQEAVKEEICNLKDLLDDCTRDMQSADTSGK